jgi:hypothetical protein
MNWGSWASRALCEAECSPPLLQYKKLYLFLRTRWGFDLVCYNQLISFKLGRNLLPFLSLLVIGNKESPFPEMQHKTLQCLRDLQAAVLFLAPLPADPRYPGKQPVSFKALSAVIGLVVLLSVSYVQVLSLKPDKA